MNIQLVERLSLHDQFRLVEIAHETSDFDVKKSALAVLQKYLNPLVVTMPTCSKCNVMTKPPVCRVLGCPFDHVDP